MVWIWLTEKDIDRLVRDRDVDGLANLIRQKDLTPEVREYLASVTADLLTGKRNFPRRRPKKKGLHSEKQKIRVKVGEALKYFKGKASR